eukprot:1158185-Pelagomonas_calceolata.AAC.2
MHRSSPQNSRLFLFATRPELKHNFSFAKPKLHLCAHRNMLQLMYAVVNDIVMILTGLASTCSSGSMQCLISECLTDLSSFMLTTLTHRIDCTALCSPTSSAMSDPPHKHFNAVSTRVCNHRKSVMECCAGLLGWVGRYEIPPLKHTRKHVRTLSLHTSLFKSSQFVGACMQCCGGLSPLPPSSLRFDGENEHEASVSNRAAVFANSCPLLRRMKGLWAALSIGLRCVSSQYHQPVNLSSIALTSIAEEPFGRGRYRQRPNAVQSLKHCRVPVRGKRHPEHTRMKPNEVRKKSGSIHILV